MKKLFFINVVVLVGIFLYLDMRYNTTQGSQQELTTVEDFALLDHEGKHHELYKYKHFPAVVLFSHGVGCPIVRHSLLSLQDLQKKYPQVAFLMLNANPQDNREDIRQEMQKFQSTIPVLKDPTQLIAQELKITRTGEALVIDPQTWEIVYRGPISDRLGYETQKVGKVQNFVNTALHALLNKQKIDIVPTEVKGCAINMQDNLSIKSQKISYTKDIVPILKNKCLECHQNNGIGPWAMTSYKKIKGWSEMIKEVVLTKRMPPWTADAHYGKFSNDTSLSVQEMRTLVHWINSGSPVDGNEDPLVKLHSKVAKQDWREGEPDVLLKLKPQKVPSTGVMDYIRYKEQVPFEEDTWIRGVDIRPGEREVMHHMIIYIYPPKDPNMDEKKQKKHKIYLCGYAPGSGADMFPENTGVLVKKGSKFEFELHYTTSGRSVVDHSQIAFYLHKEKPQREFKVGAAYDVKIRIPANDPNHEVVASHTFKRDVTLYGLSPHMHYRGKSMTFTAIYPDKSQEILLAVPNYRFDWQTGYTLSQPKTIPKGTKLVCSGAFDNSKYNEYNPDPEKEVRWGEQSWEEMYIGFFLYSPNEVSHR
ncbi:redoxin domain-containing protein [Candidatus Uabimicrobium amorphum]|uniref:Thiol-disulfide isomerase n=1 Tax=Uabimicrobium amorphum TaxID=2596890 RepID=A0A5S9F5W4_UABAM|nr:redoxin domain-containing protein [Candidatus Uabimicrobium amorphum]BBM85984.1 thiol-disulfide isomerase [Candidatus Uabimicrobium amorphum]